MIKLFDSFKLVQNAEKKTTVFIGSNATLLRKNKPMKFEKCLSYCTSEAHEDITLDWMCCILHRKFIKPITSKKTVYRAKVYRT